MTSIPVRGMDLLLSASYRMDTCQIFSLEAFGEFHPNLGAGLDTRKRDGVVWCGVCIHEHEFRIRIAWQSRTGNLANQA